MRSYSFDVDQPDVMALTSAFYDASPTVRANIRVAQGMYVVMFCAAAAVAARHYERRDIAYTLLFAMLVVLPFMPRLFRASMRRSGAKVLEESSYRRAYGRQSLALTAEALISTTPIGEAKFNWTAVDRYAVTPDYLFIFLVGPQGLVIPRTQLPAEEFRQIESFLAARLPTSG